MPALFPPCHKFKECGSFFIGVDDYPKLIEDSPDEIIECDDVCQGVNCNNLIGYPVGKLAVEVKCPFTPLTTPTLLPVSYKLPHYNACQVLTHMKAIGSKCLLFASCSLESLSVSLIDFEDSTWGRMFNFAKEMFADPEVMKPLEIQLESINIKDEVKKFAESNSLLVAEVPTLVTFDDESLSTSPMPQENNKMYRHRKKLRVSTRDRKNINEFIVDLCERNITLLEKANESLHRKASELLLFIACDSDREF